MQLYSIEASLSGKQGSSDKGSHDFIYFRRGQLMGFLEEQSVEEVG
jgi:hypothetical protein